MLQAGVLGVRFGEDWEPREELQEEYSQLQSYFPEGVIMVCLPDGK
jgi:hypothetical protein